MKTLSRTEYWVHPVAIRYSCCRLFLSKTKTQEIDFDLPVESKAKITEALKDGDKVIAILEEGKLHKATIVPKDVNKPCYSV